MRQIISRKDRERLERKLLAAYKEASGLLDEKTVAHLASENARATLKARKAEERIARRKGGLVQEICILIRYMQVCYIRIQPPVKIWMDMSYRQWRREFSQDTKEGEDGQDSTKGRRK